MVAVEVWVITTIYVTCIFKKQRAKRRVLSHLLQKKFKGGNGLSGIGQRLLGANVILLYLHHESTCDHVLSLSHS